jgi:16S rRNA processing protein RimM
MRDGMSEKSMVYIGKILCPSGLCGQMRIRSLMQTPEDIFSCKNLVLDKGLVIENMTFVRELKDTFVVHIENINDRDSAMALKGQNIYSEKDDLESLDEDEHYWEDLIGMTVVGDTRETVGAVCSVNNFGASDLLEVQTCEGKKFYVPFIEDAIMQIDTQARCITISLSFLGDTEHG